MKKIVVIKSILVVFLISLLVGACKETVNVDNTEQKAPVLTSFSPEKGKVGTEITIKGENLQTVDTVLIGGGLANLKYRINSSELVVTVSAQSKTGTILVSNAVGKSESTNPFTVEYLLPTISNFPSEGEVGAELLIKGENLESISKIVFGKDDYGKEVAGEIIYQTAQEILVIVPFIKQAEIRLYYESNEGEQYIDGIEFSIILPQPVFDELQISEETEGNPIVLHGTNLHLVDSILFGDMSAKIVSQNADSITVIVPEVSDNSILVVKACFYGSEEVILSENFTIANLLLLYWPDITLGARESGLPSFFNAIKGELYSACDIAGSDLTQNYNVHIYTDYSSSTIIFGNPANCKNKIKNFKCEGVALPSANFPNVVKYRTIDDETYINLVKNNELTIIPDTITNILGTPGTSDMLYDNGLLSEDQLTRSYKVGDVIFFALFDENASPTSLGFIHVKNVAFKTSEDGSAEKTSTITFDCYFQK